MSRETEKEISDIMKRLFGVSKAAQKESKSAFRKASGIMINAIRSAAPKSDRPHTRYKAVKFDGSVYREGFTYYPGNLRRSIRVLPLRKTDALFIGPKLDKNPSGDDYKGNKVDGYYAHWVEFGAPEIGIPPRQFVRPAVELSGKATLQYAIDVMKGKIDIAWKRSKKGGGQ